MNKNYMYDERPGFESYNSFNIPYPQNMMGFTGFNMPNYSIESLEKRVSNLENKISKLENNIYPKAMDQMISGSYQSSMNIM